MSEQELKCQFESIDKDRQGFISLEIFCQNFLPEQSKLIMMANLCKKLIAQQEVNNSKENQQLLLVRSLMLEQIESNFGKMKQVVQQKDGKTIEKDNIKKQTEWPQLSNDKSVYESLQKEQDSQSQVRPFSTDSEFLKLFSSEGEASEKQNDHSKPKDMVQRSLLELSNSVSEIKNQIGKIWLHIDDSVNAGKSSFFSPKNVDHTN